MDSQEYEDALQELHCVKESDVQYYDSKDDEGKVDFLDEAQISHRVEELVSQMSALSFQCRH